ncbi:MAG: tetratricopeptide repeat protein [Nostoc sp. DedQUE04]|uniref:tetratricopeptide repeat protein n=1 Tax=Nostoc sp. DedQUE04 TaxID=3075390 RepID=UPI002AD49F52|nr:tetratricopeptide repeat protein [Nostoc sp. DedQUE04]MDZ8140503.1 tetratricopeptide repeat protein [Nostoc sp. DedQUE04]
MNSSKDSQKHYPNIDENTYSRILELSKVGDAYTEQKEFVKAIESYHQAFDLIPEPFEAYIASTWLLTAIGESYLFMGDYEKARHALQEAMYCPDAIGNPYIHLKLGQAQLELKNFERAQEELARAYIIEGKAIFENEDLKYYEYLKTFIREVE